MNPYKQPTMRSAVGSAEKETCGEGKGGPISQKKTIDPAHASIHKGKFPIPPEDNIKSSKEGTK